MTTTTMTPETVATFDRLCEEITGRGSGMTLGQLRDAHALARELHLAEPDPGRLETLRARLEIDE